VVIAASDQEMALFPQFAEKLINIVMVVVEMR
jgi:hypothetical protein